MSQQTSHVTKQTNHMTQQKLILDINRNDVMSWKQINGLQQINIWFFITAIKKTYVLLTFLEKYGRLLFLIFTQVMQD